MAKLLILVLCILFAGVLLRVRLPSGTSPVLHVIGAVVGGAVVYYLGAIALTFYNGA